MTENRKIIQVDTRKITLDIFNDNVLLIFALNQLHNSEIVLLDKRRRAKNYEVLSVDCAVVGNDFVNNQATIRREIVRKLKP